MRHHCPDCGGETVYQAYSGGREWYCTECDSNGFYPDDMTASRLKLLQSPEGRVALRAQMDQELARKRDETD